MKRNISLRNAPHIINSGNRRRRVDAFVSTAAVILASVALSARPSAALVTIPASPLHLHPASRRASSSLLGGQFWTSSSLARSKVGPSSSSSSSRRSKKEINPLICYYADEWNDADIELAFHNGGNTASDTAAQSPQQQQQKQKQQKQQRRSISISKSASSFKRHIAKMLFKLKEQFRTRLERCTVYVLECEGGNYYVGSTTNRKRRLREHLRNKGSKWTRTHKPLKVLTEYKRIPSQFLLGMESKVTAQLMLEYGVNNVRGSMFCSPREYHTGDIDSLTKFLGHYNDLNYRKVNARLSKTLPPSPHRKRKRSNYNSYMNGRCYNCGKLGHLAASCPEKHANVVDVDDTDTDPLRP